MDVCAPQGAPNQLGIDRIVIKLNTFDYTYIFQVNNIACDDMPLILPSRALYWCLFCQKAKTFDHRFVCDAASKAHTPLPSCLNCQKTLSEHKWVESKNDMSHYRCACGARYCDHACFMQGEHMLWCPHCNYE